MNLLLLQSNYCYCNKYSYTRVGWSPSSTISTGQPRSYSLTASSVSSVPLFGARGCRLVKRIALRLS